MWSRVTTNITVISWWSVLVIGVPGENHQACRTSLTNFITKCCIEYTSPWTGFELPTLVVIGTDCTGSWIYIRSWPRRSKTWPQEIRDYKQYVTVKCSNKTAIKEKRCSVTWICVISVMLNALTCSFISISFLICSYLLFNCCETYEEIYRSVSY